MLQDGYGLAMDVLTNQLRKRAHHWVWPIGLGLLLSLTGCSTLKRFVFPVKSASATTPGSTPPAPIATKLATSTVTPQSTAVIPTTKQHNINADMTDPITIVNVDNQTLTYQIKHGNMVINGDGNTIRIQGECNTLTINGDREIVTVSRSGGTTTINGSNNDLKEHSAERVIANGDNNAVSLPDTSNISIINNGRNNTINAGSTKSSTHISSSGAGDTINIGQ